MKFTSTVLLLLVSTLACASGETISPNMGMPVPGVGVTVGPDWATDINASLSIIDGHNHCSGSGVQIPPCGIDINSDLTFAGNNATDVNSVVLDTVTGTPSVLGIYSDGVDLFYKDASGSAIQITRAHGVNVSAGNIQNLPSTPTGGAGISWNNTQGTFELFKDSGTVGANLDSGSLIVRYPGSYPAPVGNFIAIEAPSSLATGYALTLPPLPASQKFMTLNAAGTITAPWAVDNSTLEISGGTTLQVKALGITAAQIANLTITTGKIGNLEVQTPNINTGAVTSAKLASNINLDGLATNNNFPIVSMNNGGGISPRIIRGTIDALTPTPSLTAGEAFTPTYLGSGRFRIAFGPAFGSSNVVAVGSITTATSNCAVRTVNIGASLADFEVWCDGIVGAQVSIPFSFIIIGLGT